MNALIIIVLFIIVLLIYLSFLNILRVKSSIDELNIKMDYIENKLDK